MKNKKQIYKRPLRRKILIGCAIFCILSCFATGFIGAILYINGMYKQYNTYMIGIIEFVTDMTDTDDLEECIETGEQSEEYEELQGLLNEIKENYEIEYVYVVKPLNTDATDNMMNIIAGVTQYEEDHESDTLARLGQLTGDSYSPDVVQHYIDAMDSDEISFFSNETSYGHDYTALCPLINSDGEAIAVLAVDISVDDIYAVLGHYIILVLIATVALVVIFLALIYRWMSRSVIEPVSKIQAAAEKFVTDSSTQDDPEKLSYSDPGIHSEDEIESLSTSLVTLTSDLKKYMLNLVRETRDKERIGTELALATKIQADMLPCIFPPFPERTEFDIYATMNPAKEVGGDFYDLFMVDDRHLAVVMADVSGKGIPAALFMVIGKTLIKDHTKPGIALNEVFSTVNDVLCSCNNEGLFITAFEGVLDTETGEFNYVNAGHEPPFIYRAGGSYEEYNVKPGFVLAGMEGIRYKEGSLTLGIGDRIFLYTDGIPEAENASQEFYGLDRMCNALNKTCSCDTKQTLITVKKDIEAFVGEADQFDDITMLCLEYKGRS